VHGRDDPLYGLGRARGDEQGDVFAQSLGL
jgi:hypothetical protein